MKKEIGSIFPLSDKQITSANAVRYLFTDDRIYYSLCREALSDIAKNIPCEHKCVLIPAYTCQTVITPFEEAGWYCEYYSITKSLRIDGLSLLELVAKYNAAKQTLV